MSSEGKKDFPATGLNTKEGRNQCYWKTIKVFQCVHDHHLEEESHDNTDILPENLRWLLAIYKPISFRRRCKPYLQHTTWAGEQDLCRAKKLWGFVDAPKMDKCTSSSSTGNSAGAMHGKHEHRCRGFQRSHRKRNFPSLWAATQLKQRLSNQNFLVLAL